MKNLTLAWAFWLALTPGASRAEPLAIGFALKNDVFVYSDSSSSASVQDTLNLYDYVLVFGVKAGEEYRFDLNGWVRVEEAQGETGWVRYDGLAITRYIIYANTLQDSLFEAPSRQARFLGNYPWRYMHRVFERVQNEDGLWLGLQQFRGEQRWLLVKSFDYEWEDAYYNLIQAFLRDDDPFQNIRLNADYQQALAVANRLETMIAPSDTVYINKYSFIEYYDKAVGAGAMVAEIKSRIYRRLRQFEDAIRELQKIVTVYGQQPLFLGRAAAEAALDLAYLYHSDLQDTARALAQYHQVIVDYPDEPFESFEWNDWADNIAARAITALFASHPGRLYEEADRIIAESKVPAIKLVGYAAKVRSLGLQQRIAAMADTALSAMQKYPKEQRNFYLSTVDYSNNIAALVLNFFEASADLDGFYRFAEQIQTRFGDYPVGAATALRHAIVADKTNADLQTVRRLYRRVQEEFSEFRFYDSIYREDLSTARARWRLSHFQEAGILQAEISTDNAAFRVGFEAQYPAILFLPAGRHAKILYSDENLKPYNEPSRYAKILLDDGQAGWVLKELLNPIREAVFENASDSHPAWSMALANSANNPVFAGPEIRQPKIVNVLENYAINGLRFFDVNGDQTLDLLLQQRYSRSTYGQGIVLAVAGRSHELLQSYGAGSLENFISYPDLVTGANKLFCKGYVRRPNSWGTGELRAYDLYSGALVWTAPQAFDDFSNLIYYNGRIYSVAADSLIQCFNSESGELQWTVSMGATVTGYRQRIQLAVHARALVAMAYDKSVFAFHPETGEQLWRSPARAFATTPVLDEEAVYLSSMRLTLTALRLADGAVKWERRLSSANSADFCLVTAQRVLYPSPEGILALDKYSGQTVWVNQSIAAGHSMIAAGNAIYLIGRFSGDESYSEYLLALREHDGKLLWRMPMNSYYSPLIYQSGRLFVQGETGVLVIADSASSRFADPGSPAFQLSQNYPNPFNGQTLISFELRAGENVQLTIYNVMGQRVRQLINGFHHPGWYTAIWDGTNEAGQKVGSGIYFYKLNVGKEAGTKRLLFLK